MEITGKAIAALQPRKGISKRTGEEWMTREYVIETQEQYPKKMVFEVFGRENIEKFNIRKDDIITVHFDIDAREWQGRWFNQIRAWKVEHAAASTPAPSAAPASSQSAPAPVRQPEPKSSADDNLPF